MATTTPALDQVYPLSTADHTAIPHDVAGPRGIIRLDVAASGISSLDMSATAEKIASFYSKVGCIIQFGQNTLVNPPASGVVYTKALLIPPESIIVASLTPGIWYCAPIASGKAAVLWIQFLQKWATIALDRQVTSK